MLPPQTAQENCRILQQLVELRAQKSVLLGFDTHAAFVLEMNMAKECKTVASFLGEAWGRLEGTSQERSAERREPCPPWHLLAAQGPRAPFSRNA